MEIFLISPNLNEDVIICSNLIAVIKIYSSDSDFIQI